MLQKVFDIQQLLLITNTSRGIILKSTSINQYGNTPVTKSKWTAEMTFQHWSYRGRCNKGDGRYELLAGNIRAKYRANFQQQ